MFGIIKASSFCYVFLTRLNFIVSIVLITVMLDKANLERSTNNRFILNYISSRFLGHLGKLLFYTRDKNEITQQSLHDLWLSFKNYSF